MMAMSYSRYSPLNAYHRAETHSSQLVNWCHIKVVPLCAYICDVEDHNTLFLMNLIKPYPLGRFVNTERNI